MQCLCDRVSCHWQEKSCHVSPLLTWRLPQNFSCNTHNTKQCIIRETCLGTISPTLAMVSPRAISETEQFETNIGVTMVEFNSPGVFDYSLKFVNFKLISTIKILSIFYEIAIRWMPQHLTDHQSTLVQVMAWCRQVTSLSQCWPRSLSPYDVTRPQWVKH